LDTFRGWAEFAAFLPVIAWQSTPDGIVKEWNRQWFVTTGASPGEPLERWIDRLHPEDRDRWPEEMRRFSSQAAPFSGRFRVWSVGNGQYRQHLARVGPRLDGSGLIEGWTGVATDTEDQATGPRVQVLEDALVREQEQLRLFAYGASHDLREPARTVHSYVDLLAKHHGESIGEPGREYLNFLHEGAERLRRLTDDLLTYSRVSGSDALVRKRVQMRGVIQWAVMNLAQPVQESGAEIDWGDMPAVMADENRLVLVVQNLLSNSLKFRRDGHPPRVRITAEQGEGEWVFAFADNGTGFDERYADQIFSVFKRLHGREYSGSGLGLAVARKVIERHGGRMWAHSTPGVGSQFYFSLPD
jgi:signal transduction histidine kinase